MSDDTILSHAEALAEVKRLRARVIALEAEIAIIRGTLAKPDDEPSFRVTDAAPSTPR